MGATGGERAECGVRLGVADHHSELSFLDLALPTPAQLLAASRGPVVLVPLLLNTGYHVTVDLPAVRAAAPHPDIRQAAPLGPDPLPAAALAGRPMRTRPRTAVDRPGRTPSYWRPPGPPIRRPARTPR
ncbi:hypothetical protein OHU11_37765 [Streptomyces sp. NBC_00257]|uniref:sirohydrochlorin chelatase n=1 Tax=unclassified Streptomyces TaxID=2593676 RepID=UPI002258CB2C|nr:MULTISPECIES: CbiX/SirB N-terminal domain-containing protein [unclassified Streptomyces]WTB59571.1 hypothetical protein OG832_05290 [Streptomyces sp. NBC_00826]WTH95847.1 hypothetical protein OIC43_38395 [Streptomyces sp. NBC_00825]WTI04568.1 hypothetical protein OHA23_38375 [Streptomyces sp. NBC_00822]MCX4868779.1 hypothetical protein [Streptomyces sp. NBC_00906]MCX4900017.1 hypothetical protein [Streptomyces sp. NBC_00892]